MHVQTFKIKKGACLAVLTDSPEYSQQQVLLFLLIEVLKQLAD